MLKNSKYFLLYLITISTNIFAQSAYVLNGDATKIDCHCYTLTIAKTIQSGSIWNKNKIDLTQPFDYTFSVFLGCLDTSGADGIVFILQTDSTSLGTAGEGIGFGGIVPSIGVTIDTYQNFNDSDPVYDHIAIQANGDVEHSSPNNLAGPVPALATSNNIEDCKWHSLHVNWQPATQLFQISMDGTLRLSLKRDFVGKNFNNNPLVYWGFTGATGDSINLQQVCMPLNAKYGLASHINTCIGTPLKFTDSSKSFGSITNWYWNFGDGTTSNQQNPAAHIYSAAGIYNTTLNIKGNDGCLSDTFKNVITIGSYPVADFKMLPSPICPNTATNFLNTSALQVGTQSYWYWNFGNGATSNQQNPTNQLFNAGTYSVTFIVKSIEGCADTAEKNITVLPLPAIDFTAADACKNSPVNFSAKNSGTINITQWNWNFGDNNFSNNQSVLHTYTNGGIFNVQLTAVTANGCTDTVSKPVKIYATNAYAGNDTTILINFPYQLHASGGDTYSWSPSGGLSNPFIANPVVTLSSNATYILTASTVLGCATKDTLNLKVAKGPAIYAPSAFTPNNDGRNDRYKIIPVGVNLSAFKIFNRWGKIIYSSLNTNEGWDGNLNGVPQPSGTYIWVAVGTSFNNQFLNKQGTLVLIR